MAVAGNRRIARRLLTTAIWSAALAGCGRSEPSAEPAVPPDLIDQANKHFANGRYLQASEAYRRILQADPAKTDVRKHLAYALAGLERFDQVDLVLRSAPSPPESADPQVDMMRWRRAFNIYRHYYHVTSPNPQGVFRAGTIHDALEALELSDLPTRQPSGLEPLRVDDLVDLLGLWVRWDQVARDADLFPDCQWLPLLVVAEAERLRGQIDQLTELERRTTGAVWLHPDDHGNWLIHPGAMNADTASSPDPPDGADVAVELTETAGPSTDLVYAWDRLVRWLAEHVPSASVTVVAAVRPSADRPFDRRLALVGRMHDYRLVVQHVRMEGPSEALVRGFAEYRRLRRAENVAATSTKEIESLAAAYSAAGLPATGFHVDERRGVFAADRDQLACLLSFVRHAGALFDGPETKPAPPGP